MTHDPDLCRLTGYDGRPPCPVCGGVRKRRPAITVRELIDSARLWAYEERKAALTKEKK